MDHNGCCYCKFDEYNLKNKGYELKLHYYFVILLGNHDKVCIPSGVFEGGIPGACRLHEFAGSFDQYFAYRFCRVD